MTSICWNDKVFDSPLMWTPSQLKGKRKIRWLNHNKQLPPLCWRNTLAMIKSSMSSESENGEEERERERERERESVSEGEENLTFRSLVTPGD